MVLNLKLAIDPSLHLKKCIITFDTIFYNITKPVEGLLYTDGKHWYVFQNSLDGAYPDNKPHKNYGFKYSWLIGVKYCSSPKVSKIEIFLEEEVEVWY